MWMRGALFVAVLIGLAVAQPISDYTNTWVNGGAMPASPAALSDHGVAVSSGDIFVTGGTLAGGAQSAATYIFDGDLQTWRQFIVGPGGDNIGQVAGHVFMASSQQPTELYVWGGCTLNCVNLSPPDSVYLFDSAAASGVGQWTILPSATFPKKRAFAASALWASPTGEVVVVWGGRTDVPDSAVYFLQTSDIRTGSPWIQVTATNPAPVQIAGATAAVVGQGFFVYGGVETVSTLYSSALYRFDLVTKVWSTLSVSGAPGGPRAYASATLLYGGMLLLHGGETTGATPLATTVVANLTATTVPFTAVATNTGSARAHSPAVLFQGNAVVFGGLVNGAAANAFATYYVRPTVSAISRSEGLNCGGYTVTVFGAQFQAGSGVCNFGAVSVPATFVNSSAVTCVVPQPLIITAADAIATVSVVVGNRASLPSTAAPHVAFSYQEGPSSRLENTTEPYSVPEGTAGTPTVIPIQTRGACGIVRASSLLVPSNEFGGDDTLVANVTDIALASNFYATAVAHVTAGQYTATFTTTVAASYRLQVYLNGGVLAEPVVLQVGPNLPISAASSVVGAPASIEAGLPTVFTIVSADVYGNSVTNPSLFVITATLQQADPPVVVLGAAELSGSALIGRLITTVAGSYSITVAIKVGASSAQPPFSLFQVVTVAGPFNVPTTTASGQAADFATVGVPSNIVIQPRDQYGNVVTISGVVFGLALSGSYDINGTVTEDPIAHTYVATYEATRVGQYAIGITAGNAPIAGSPFSVTLRLAADPEPANAVAFGYGVRGAVAGQSGYFTVQSRDKYDNTFDHGNMSVALRGGFMSSSHAVNLGDGSYTCYYAVKHLGHFGKQKLSVLADGKHIRGSPFRVKIQYGIAFFLIVFFAVLLGAVCLAIVCSYVFADMYRRYQARKIAKNPKAFFPEVLDDPNAEREAWQHDPSYLDPQHGLEMQNLGFEANDFVADFDVDAHTGETGGAGGAGGAGGGGGGGGASQAADRNNVALDAIARN